MTQWRSQARHEDAVHHFEVFAPQRDSLVRNINALTELGRAQPGIDACLSLSLSPTSVMAEKAGTPEIIKYGDPNWAGTKEAQTDWIDQVLWNRRGWSWITKGDARTLAGQSTTKAIFQQALDPEAARKIFALGADVSSAAYDAVGKVPERPRVRRWPQRCARQTNLGGRIVETRSVNCQAVSGTRPGATPCPDAAL